MTWLRKLLYPVLVTFECPKCGAEIGNFDIKFGTPFACERCKCLLSLSQSYDRWVTWSCLIVGTLVSLPVLLWLSWSSLWLWPLCAFGSSLVVAAIASVYVKIVFPPKLQLYTPQEAPLTLFRRRP